MTTDCYDSVWASGDGTDPVTLLLLHGTGDNAASFMEVGRQLRPRAAALSVQGNVDEHGMARFFRRLGMGVYDMADLARRTTELAGFVEAKLAEHGREPAQALGIGYSNGANILANLLVTQPGLVRRAVLLHPLIPFDLPTADLTGTAVLVTAGRADPICPWPLTERLVDGLRSRGAAVDLVTHQGGHEIAAAEWRAVGQYVSG